jgi:ferredoxin-NADP reductase
VLSEGNEGFISRVGRVDSQIIREEIPDYRERKFYLCGPPAMVEAMKAMLTDGLSVTEDSIVTENFQGY